MRSSCKPGTRACWAKPHPIPATPNATPSSATTFHFNLDLPASRSMSLRLELQNRAVVLVGQHVDETVGTLSDVADPLFEVGEQRFARDRKAFRVQDDALQHHAAHAADEQVAFPALELFAGVIQESGRRNRGH